MMDDIILAPTTLGYVNKYLKNPQQTLIISGKKGTGKKYLATKISKFILKKNNLKNDSSYLDVAPENNSISIEQIRELQNNLKLKVVSTEYLNRVITIFDAHTLTIEAQNALLKTLEEPPKGTVIILTANEINSLLPTIISRSSLLKINRVSNEQIRKLYSSHYPESQIEMAIKISDGRIGLINSILNDTSNDIMQSLEYAKTILIKSPFERLAEINNIKTRIDAQNIIELISLLARVSLKSKNPIDSKRWLKIYKNSIKTNEMILNNVSSRTALTYLFMDL